MLASSGAEIRGDGYLLMYRADADTVNMNAKITKIGTMVVEYYVTEKVPAVHYEDAQMVAVVYQSEEKGGE